MTKLGLLSRMQLNKGEGGIWDHLTDSRKSLEEWIECPLLSWIECLNWKQAWEEESLMKDYSPAPQRKTQRLIPSPLVMNSPENSSATTQSTSKSQSTICSMHEHYPSSLTLSRSKLLQGKAFDLNVIISVIHSIITDDWATESFGDFELQFGHLKLTKMVKTHRDWLITYDTFQHVMQFVHPHREGELLCYREYVTAYFTSLDATRQGQALNLNKAIRQWSGSVNNVSLNQFKRFWFLEVWHVFSKAAGNLAPQGAQRTGVNMQHGSGSV